MDVPTFDLIVIGAGSAGTSGAFAAGLAGKRVALIERSDTLGGAGINTGTVPSKTLRESALLLNGWRMRKLLGIEVHLRPHTSLADFAYHARNVLAAERSRLEERARQTHVQRFTGNARFVDPHTVAIESPDGAESRIRGEFILIATGSSPVRPPEFPFEHPRVHDSDQLLRIKEIPRSLAVIGAGVIGAEYACTFAALGVEVHIIDGRDRLLPFLDAEVSETLSRAMSASGVKFHWNEKVQKCDPAGSAEVRLTLSSGATITVSDVLVAAGRQSNTAGLNLEAAGLTPSQRGVIPVDPHFCTKVTHIYAAGDVAGPPSLASAGIEQARVAVCHAFDILDKNAPVLIPSGIYTIPEASCVGETEQSLKEKKIPYVVGRATYTQSPRGRIIGDENGFLKLLFRDSDLRLLGAHAVGEQAIELVHIGLIAMLAGQGAEIFSRACFNYPTLGDLYKYAAYDAIIKHLKVAPADAPHPGSIR